VTIHAVTCPQCRRDVRLIRGRCPNCDALIDARHAPPPQKLSSGGSWWHDDLGLLAGLAFGVSAIGGAAYFAITSLI
jgi:hypothetical protein